MKYASLFRDDKTLFTQFQELCMMIGSYLQDESTALSQVAIQTLVKYLQMMEANCLEMLKAAQPQLQQLFLSQLKESFDSNKTVYVRFYELAVELALKSPMLCQSVARPIITQVFQDFFQTMDLLTQVTIMDFVVKLTENENGVYLMNESNFIDNLFSHFGGDNEDSFGFITSNLLVVGAKLYSIDTALFDPFANQNFMHMLRAYLS